MSKLKEIKAKLAALLITMSSIKTNKAVLSYDSDGEILTGMAVYVLDEKDEKQAVEDGEYMTEDNKQITVKDSVVTEIKEVTPAEEAPAEDVVEAEKKEKCEDVAEEEEVVDNQKDSDDLAAKVDELMTKVDELTTIVEKMVEKMAKNETEVAEKMSKIEKMSAAQPAKDVINNTVIAAGDKKIEKFSKFFN